MSEYRVDGFDFGSWGVIQGHFDNKAEAIKWARQNVRRMSWRVVRATEEVVARGGEAKE